MQHFKGACIAFPRDGRTCIMPMNQNTASHVFSVGVYRSSLDSKRDVADVGTKERANEM